MEENLRQLLLKDLCARLPYGVVLDVDTSDWTAPQGNIKLKIEGIGILFKGLSLIVNGSYYGEKYKPYLRPMSSMTVDEKAEFEELWDSGFGKALDAQISNGIIEILNTTEDSSFDDHVVRNLEIIASSDAIDWLIARHFDFRGLIEKGLAIAVTEENNPYK